MPLSCMNIQSAAHLAVEEGIASTRGISLLDVEAVATRLEVRNRFIRRLVLERRIPFHKIGRLIRFDPVEIDRWIAEQRIDPKG